jgi:hypothetical protein
LTSKDETEPKPDYISEYMTLLDSQARFYNSEETVHAGYLIASFVGLLALFNLIRGDVIQFFGWICFWANVSPALAPALAYSLLGVLLILYLLLNKPLPFLFPYLLGRVQYYGTLSWIVWEHMGVTGATEEYFVSLRSRVLRKHEKDYPLGLSLAIKSLFEARLYVSLCLNSKKKPEPNWWEHFYLLENEATRLYDPNMTPEENKEEHPLYSKGEIFSIFSKTKLLHLAYQPTLDSYRNVGDAREKAVVRLMGTQT